MKAGLGINSQSLFPKEGCYLRLFITWSLRESRFRSYSTALATAKPGTTSLSEILICYNCYIHHHHRHHHQHHRPDDFYFYSCISIALCFQWFQTLSLVICGRNLRRGDAVFKILHRVNVIESQAQKLHSYVQL